MAAKEKARPGASDWIAKLKPELREIAQALRKLLLDAEPGFEESIKWGQLCYAKSGLICFMMAAKAHVTFGFFNGVGLRHPPSGHSFAGGGTKTAIVEEISVSPISR
ncbi:MAG: DUF1801 domain-containing protein [Planctomycetes bacterium]|nr:DUF1801 domain-containing protein [Planctomycetota bacterium]